MASLEEVAKFRTNIKSSSRLLGVPPVTLHSWARVFNIRGGRGWRGLGITHLTKFRFISILSRSGVFGRPHIKAALGLMNWMAEKDVDHDAMFFLSPAGVGTVDIVQYSPRDFPAAAAYVAECHVLGCFISLSGIAKDITGRVAARIDGVPYISEGEKFRSSLLAVIAKRKQEEEADEKDEDREAATVQPMTQ